MRKRELEGMSLVGMIFMLIIDGAYGEGGGQIIRTAVALSAISQKPVKIENIRANRPNPGLQPQHLTAVSAVAKLCNAKTDAKLGSTSVVFEPRKIKSGRQSINIGTAGAISLVLQPAILVALNADGPVRLEITGGTHVQWSPTIDYMKTVFVFFMSRLGLDVNIETVYHGFYPKGGGVVKAEILPSKPLVLNLIERGDLFSIDIVSVASEDLKKSAVAERQAEGFGKIMKADRYAINYVSSPSPGSSFHAHAQFANTILGASALGKRGIPAQKVGQHAAIALKNEMSSGACIDSHMVDQILPFLAPGSRIRASLTSHAKTNIWLIEQFMPVKFEIENDVISVKNV
jgi:RNA 3'-phosphate cyclase